MLFIGEKLKEIREIKGLSMRDLEKISGIKQGYISQIENGLKQPRSDKVKALSEALGVDEQYFYLEDAKLVISVAPDLPDELKEWVLNAKNIPWLLISQKAASQGISPDIMEKMIELLHVSQNTEK